MEEIIIAALIVALILEHIRANAAEEAFRKAAGARKSNRKQEVK